MRILRARGVGADFDNHFRCARDHELARGLNALALDVGKDIDAAGGVEHVVKKSDGAARIDAAQRLGVAPEHEQRSRPRTAGDAFS